MAERRNFTRTSTAKSIPIAEAKTKVIELIAAGAKREEAMQAVGRSIETYRSWQKNDPRFKAEIEKLRNTAAMGAGAPEPIPSFPDFADKYLHQPLGIHHLRMLDVIEGREPRELHDNMVYQKGDPSRVILNLPPGHAKTITWSVNYVVWRIHQNPDLLVTIVSKSRDLAEQILGAVKHRLTSHLYQDMHLRFAPDGGWKDPDGSWNMTQIFVKGRGAGEKDPTVQALGFGSRIYGTRSNLIILDDVVDLSSAGSVDKQLRWLTQEVESRLKPGQDQMLVLGTRVAPVDLYKKLRDDFEDLDGSPAWTYLSQPAILEEPDKTKPETWTTLWPEATENGETNEQWSGRRLAKVRGRMMDDRQFQLVYQQADVNETAIFPPEVIRTAIDGMRWHGPLKKGAVGHREDGMDGLMIVAGVDPATVGHTAMIVGGFDRKTQKRWILDGWDKPGASPLEIRNKMKEWTELYGIKKWVVERNAFQAYLTRDEELLAWLYAHGSTMQEHYSTGNKYDPGFGVASMAPLFFSCGTPQEENRDGWIRNAHGGLIELPNIRKNSALSILIEQLGIWRPPIPGQRDPIQDMVMALWFLEIGIREYLDVWGNADQDFFDNGMTTRLDAQHRGVIDLNEFEASLAE